MPCPPCQRRSALLAELAPAISRLTFTRQTLLKLLALPDAQLLRAAKIEDPARLLRGLYWPLPTDRVPTAFCRHDPLYPAALAQLPSAPAILYATCTADRLRALLSKPTVALVGSRIPTDYARQITSALAHDLSAAGVTVISSVNDGLEGFAQRAALRDDRPAIAVMACSPDLSHLARHDHLHRRILAHGAAISEFPPAFFPPRLWCFIASHRIIAALANLTVVLEIGERSPALLTSQIASDLGREVAALPGRITDPGGQLLFELLRDGAHPVACAQDVLELIGEVRGVRGVAA
jgi:DNA processing protein